MTDKTKLDAATIERLKMFVWRFRMDAPFLTVDDKVNFLMDKIQSSIQTKNKAIIDRRNRDAYQ